MILLTVPHSKCLNHKNHLCDYLAPSAAENLRRKFSDCILILSNKNRTEVDYNRKKARDEEWRIIIRKTIISMKPSFLLDIHSFPPDSDSFGYFDSLSLPEIVLLDSYYDKKFLDKDTSINFNNYLLKNKIKSKLLVGGDNDIILDGRKLNIKSILIEYNESLSKNRLNFINTVIASYFQ